MLAGYERSLGWALSHGPLMMLILLATVCLNVYLYIVIPKGFFPQQDTGQLRGGIRADQSTSFQLMKQKLIQVADIIQSDPAVATVVGSTGGGSGGFGGATNNANVDISLKPLAERKVSADRVIARLRPRLARIRGAQAFIQANQDIRIGGRAANSQYQYTLQGDDVAELRTWAEKLRQALQDVPEVADVDSDQQVGGLETDLTVDRHTASRLGLSESQIDNTLYDAFGQRLVSTIYDALNQYHVVMEVSPEYWQSPETLRDIYISTSGGAVSGTEVDQRRCRHDRADRPNRVKEQRRGSAAANNAASSAATANNAASLAGAMPLRTWPPTRWPMPAAAIRRRAPP